MRERERGREREREEREREGGREREREIVHPCLCCFRYPSALRNLLRHVLHMKGFIRTKLEENDRVS